MAIILILLTLINICGGGRLELVTAAKRPCLWDDTGHNKPVQFIPSPWNPILHWQVKLPTVFIHAALVWQLCWFCTHSSISVGRSRSTCWERVYEAITKPKKLTFSLNQFKHLIIGMWWSQKDSMCLAAVVSLKIHYTATIYTPV